MTDNTELKRLVDRVLTDRRFCGDENHKALADGVLALIAENERLKESHEQVFTNYNQVSYASEERGKQIDQLRAENAGLKTGYEAYERVNAELKAEVGALRKAIDVAAARMIAAKECFDRDYPGEWSGELHLAVGIKEIDAALGQGEQS